jgi:KTSC domain
MKTTAVQSATLAMIGYDDAGGILELEFLSRAVYRYFGVPGAVYEALLAAPSKGSCFNHTIRGVFPHLRISESRAILAWER